MSNEPGTRIGCVRYLNSKPLIHGHDKAVSFEVPASLADGLHEGRLDVALSPIFGLMAHPGYLVVDDVAVASRGKVFSVFIAYQGEFSRLHTLYLDAASRTSANLQRVLLAEFHGLHPRELPRPAGQHPAELREGEGALLIGDPAIDFRVAWGEDRCRYFDLGEEWQRATGLPFVFAAWLVRPGTPEPEALADRLRAWRAEGQQRINEVIANENALPARADPRLPDRTHPLPPRRAGKNARFGNSPGCCASTVS